jgi:protoheme IX farnesyltransferase
MIAAYFIGVGLVGAGLAALAINVLWRAGGGEPPTVVIVVAAVLGALFIAQAIRLARDTTPAQAIRLFTYSNTYLALLFAAVAVDSLLRTV